MGFTITLQPESEEQNCELKMKSSTIQIIKDHLVGIRAGFMLAWLLYSYLVFREDPENRYEVRESFFLSFSYSSLISIFFFRVNISSITSPTPTSSAVQFGPLSPSLLDTRRTSDCFSGKSGFPLRPQPVPGSSHLSTGWWWKPPISHFTAFGNTAFLASSLLSIF